MCYSTISNNEQQILSKITLFVLVTSVLHIIISQQPYVSGTKIIVTTRRNNFFRSKYCPNLSVVGGAQKSTSIQEENSYDDDDDNDDDDNDDDEIINSELDRPNAIFGWSFISAFKVNEQAKEELLNEDKEYDENKKGFDLSSIQQKTIVGGAKTVKSSLSAEEIDQKQDPKNLITNPKNFTIQSQKNRIKEVATASDRLIDDDSEKEKELQSQDESTSSVDQTEDYYSYEYDEDESLLYDFVYDEGSDVDGLITNSSTKEEETSPNTTALEKTNNSNNSLEAKIVSVPTVRINEPMTETSFAKNISTMVSEEGESNLQVNYVDKEKLDLSETRLSNISKSITTPTPSTINTRFLLPPPSLSVNKIKETPSSTESVFISTGYVSAKEI